MLQIYNIRNVLVKYFCNYFYNYFLFGCGLGGWRMLILQFFGGFVVSFLASTGVLQTPGTEDLVFPAHLRCTGLL